MESLSHNQTWDLVRFPAGKITLQNKWVYKLKEEDGGKQRYKARLVARGFVQKKDIDFDEIFSPIVKMTSIITILSLVAVEDFHLEQLDVKTTFLHGDLEEEIYMQQTQGYEVLTCVLKRKLVNSFAMKDLGVAKQILGMRITRDRKNHKLTLPQSEYIEKVLKRFNMQNAKPASKPLASHFKLMGVVSRYMNNPGKEHWMAVKWIFRCLRGTTNQALCFGCSNISLQGYVDANMVGDRDNKRSTTGYVFTVGGTTISWVSKLQSVVALSTTEAEYVATTKASKKMIWLQRFLDELGKKQELGRLYSESQSAIHLTKNSTFHSKTRHIHLKYHYTVNVGRWIVEAGKDTH
eukprot:PITA_31249